MAKEKKKDEELAENLHNEGITPALTEEEKAHIKAERKKKKKEKAAKKGHNSVIIPPLTEEEKIEEQRLAEEKARIKAERKKAEKQAERETLNGNKSAQMIFKTALRNHIDLTSIADNKANLMLSINALIITVAMPLLAANIEEHTHLIFPVGILLVTCVVSMVYATLATRPIETKGDTSLEQIKSMTSNLFFYGNFHKMGFKKYKEGVKIVMGSDEKLDDSIMSDLYYLGEALGKKFGLLRICYSIFMFGIISSVVLFSILLFFNHSGA